MHESSQQTGQPPSDALPESVTWALVLDVLNTFEAAGFKRCDSDENVGHAIQLIGRAARVYAGRPA